MLSVNKHPFYTQHPPKYIFAYSACSVLLYPGYSVATPWILPGYSVVTPYIPRTLLRRSFQSLYRFFITSYKDLFTYYRNRALQKRILL